MDDPLTDDEEEFMDSELETGEIAPDLQSSLVSDMYNSEESDECKDRTPSDLSDSSGAVSLQTSSGTVTVTEVNSVKADLSDVKKSNRETMSYLKSKRIVRHKNSEFEPSKKQKVGD